VKSEHKSFIVMTESGVQHSLRKLAPEKTFTFVTNENCNCSECPYMKRNSLEKLRDSLATLSPRVELDTDMMDRARGSIERMLAVK
jgi:quinolinate synthase